jgi:hypothetical protein
MTVNTMTMSPGNPKVALSVPASSPTGPPSAGSASSTTQANAPASAALSYQSASSPTSSEQRAATPGADLQQRRQKHSRCERSDYPRSLHARFTTSC